MLIAEAIPKARLVYMSPILYSQILQLQRCHTDSNQLAGLKGICIYVPNNLCTTITAVKSAFMKPCTVILNHKGAAILPQNTKGIIHLQLCTDTCYHIN